MVYELFSGFQNSSYFGKTAMSVKHILKTIIMAFPEGLALDDLRVAYCRVTGDHNIPFFRLQYDSLYHLIGEIPDITYKSGFFFGKRYIPETIDMKYNMEIENARESKNFHLRQNYFVPQDKRFPRAYKRKQNSFEDCEDNDDISSTTSDSEMKRWKLENDFSEVLYDDEESWE